ncbi:TPA: right-handed parallel beta-helix repeat-containing protein [Enterobacter bugandensis]|uniref:tail fiber/spike domain-containing protein n=1 Tax=Enterobacter bugandensis TaxID=881260 RepID=UPI0009082A24|nr:right-handed parallel beta-helix repeat-containing protein [Enterobacter bugandensis]HCK7257457.1 right-handed parallel beta-helix repeat-containing protein [Enterobacter bugandensis]HCK7307190.1 right-handed parallel beta-helix repeat-containing protein [Enterobacter bugandensis]HCK7320898.1 right-handed parallel beta-helix repeat-containing protein [Enterobacter bugandensis]HEG2134935.1 right-handed parallel beta-helix repeat-containing protein [Enterobacter bugandensis]HEG2140293.1 right
MAEQKVKLTELPTATDTLDTAQLLVNQNSTDQKLAITHLLRAKNNLSELEDFAQARANLDVPSVEEVNNKLSGFIDGSYTFSAGGSLASRSDFIWDEDTKSWYYWSGVLPKEVPAASNPDSTGGTGVGAWIPLGESVLRGDLANPTGSSLIGYQYPADGSVSRTVQDKLDDFVFLEDFGGKANDNAVDNSLAFTKAFAASPRVRLKSPGVYYMKTRDVVLPANWHIEGSGFNTELKYPGTDTTFTMFTANGTGPEDANQIQGGVFRNVVISADVALEGAFVFRHLKHALWDRCFFYNTGTKMDNFHYIDYIFCQRWGSPFYGAATLNTEKHISEMPRWLNCFSSSSPIDLVDTTDSVLANSIFYGGEFVVRQRYTAPGLLPGDKTYGFPIHINHCVMDAVRGTALDLDRLAYFTITGNLISAGRDLERDGVLITNSVSGTFSDNVITFSGAFGLRADTLYQCNFGGNILNGNKTGGMSLSNSKQCTVSGGAMGTSYSYGGYYVQPVGFTDPANSCTDITLMGIQLDDDLTVKISIDTNPASKNRVLACRGVPDTFYSGPTSARPSPVGMGFTYFDTTIGLQIQWNSTTGHWQRYDGTNV